MLKFNDFISEAHRGVDNYLISFDFKGQNYEIVSSTMRDLFCDVVDWLYERGYDFSPLTFSVDEMNTKIKTTTYRIGHFHNISDSGNVIQIHINNPKLPQYLVSRMEEFLTNFGAEDVKFEGFDIYQKSQKSEVENPETAEDLSGESDEVKRPYIFLKNPFRQSLCVVGDPGAGKSQTMLNILENEGHKTLLFIPTELSTSMVVQYSEGRLRLNRLGSFIVRAYEQPDTLFTVLIDEFHKPMTIKRVNDELLQAISTSRYSGNRFLTLEVAEELMEEKLKSLGLNEDDYLYHSNIRIPDNLGFVLLTSKPSVIVDNKDIYDRVNIAEIRRDYYDEMTRESRVKNLSDLSGIILKTKEEKDKFKEELKSRDI